MGSRRRFLQLGGAAAAAMVLDPEFALWVPGQKTIFLPSTDIVEAKTLAEALSLGLVAVFPDGSRMEVVIGGGDDRTVGERFERERRAIGAMGGQVIEHRQYRRHSVLRAGVA